jgi:hypothetical protein
VRAILLGLILVFGCTGDHVVGSTMPTGGAGGSGGSGGIGGTGGTGGSGGMITDGGGIDASVDGGACGARNEPCCTTGRACNPTLSCQNGICR